MSAPLVEQAFGPARKPIVVNPSLGRAPLSIRELWSYRELLYFLVWRDLKVRYKQTALGAAWALLQPLLAMFVFSLFFGRLARIDSEGIPYPVFTLAALVPWSFFVYGLTEGANSLVAQRQLVTKVYFPRIAIPLAPLLAALADLAIAFVLLLVVMAWYGIVPGPQSAAVVAFVALAFAAALGAALWLSALNVRYRDVRYVLPFLAQLWFFATPVVYPSSLVPERWHVLYGLNPMVGVVDGFRWALLGREIDAAAVAISCASAAALVVGGAAFFRRTERTFADVV